LEKARKEAGRDGAVGGVSTLGLHQSQDPERVHLRLSQVVVWVVAARTTHHSGESLSPVSVFVGLQQHGAGVVYPLCQRLFRKQLTGMDGWMDGTVAPVFDPKDKMRATDDKKQRRSLALISFFSFAASFTSQPNRTGGSGRGERGATSVVTQ
jgi:hypothetical protein